jgi:ubiquitin conjugation factor E4 B
MERERQLHMDERICSTYMMLANETVYMFDYMTTEVIQPFLRPEIIDRLAAMLNYNIVQLVGPKSSDLKVYIYMMMMIGKECFLKPYKIVMIP